MEKSLRYILNPDKTDGLVLTASVNCITNARDAYLEMKTVYDHFARDSFDSPPPLIGKGTVKAIHYVMSFADDENVTPELAHKIAKAFVRKNFGDDVQAVIATHVDASHIHNHVIINSYSLSGQKYYSNRSSLRQARETTNGVCRAFGVTPALNFENKGRSVSYYEWEQNKKGSSWKEQIRQEIDKLIPSFNSLDDLLQALEERGYEVKRGKYISIKAPGQQRFVRTKTLGEEYTEDSLNTRIIYREMGAGTTPVIDNKSQLRADYAAILSDVRILAIQRKKVPRKRIITAEYSVDNDLDLYRLSAQLSVINKDNIRSIGDLEGRIAKLKNEYENLRQEINEHIEEYNRMVSLLEQAQLFKELSNKGKLSDAEQLQLAVCRQALEQNDIHSPADADSLREKTRHLGIKISALKENLEGCRNRYDVYSDISKTYGEISKDDYISDLVEEEKQWRKQVAKKDKRKI
ncbi:relaxase/mobilization nuclease domain-containing protein [Ruminococcus sp. NK3A76]|uniref:relaxase/mobilization nuclease domain-containing protein n=1 Tax=Ruminococcus sp. NK3A76 TaxID=877411 RepID=UPI00048F8074|nr:relaxase/mobilization nuclease domain-containing protein [Ruminococcus sp. NK3A76]